jgi:mycothiol synthase
VLHDDVVVLALRRAPELELRDEPASGAAAQALWVEYQSLVRERLGPGFVPEEAIFGTERMFEEKGAAFVVLYGRGRPVACGGVRSMGPELAEIKRMFVTEDVRRQGHGRALLAELERLVEAGSDGPRVWAHGDRPEAAGLAAAAGYRRVRELWRMQRSLTEPLPVTKPLEGLRLRPFRPGEDEDAWLSVNARAFAHHPEQGGWTRIDLAERESSDWFDPAGLLIAEDTSGAMAGFHWTKEHRDPGTTPIGEVYVLAVDPAYQGRGLAPALTAAGLEHLRSRGLTEVLLYVDGDNAAAIATYRRLGFERVAMDVMYGRSAGGGQDGER